MNLGIGCLLAITFSLFSCKSTNQLDASSREAQSGLNSRKIANYTPLKKTGIMLILDENSGIGSFQFAGNPAWGFVGEIEYLGTNKTNFFLKSPGVCYVFHLSKLAGDRVEVGLDWNYDLPDSQRTAACMEPGNKATGVYKMTSEAKGASISRDLVNYTPLEKTGIMLLLDENSGTGSFQFAGNPPWGFVGEIEYLGTNKTNFFLKSPGICYVFHFSKLARDKVEVGLDWNYDLPDSQRTAACMEPGNKATGVYRKSDSAL